MTSKSLRKSWRCCFEWGHTGGDYFLFTRYFLLLLLSLFPSSIWMLSRHAPSLSFVLRRRRVLLKKNWINIHQGGWMLSINRITLVKERERERERKKRAESWLELEGDFLFSKESHPPSKKKRLLKSKKKKPSSCVLYYLGVIWKKKRKKDGDRLCLCSSSNSLHYVCPDLCVSCK
jgi:hypothetical protein